MVVGGGSARHRLTLLRSALESRDFGPQCRLVSDAVQPVGDHLARPNGSGLLYEHEKRGMKSILGPVMLAQHPAANAEHHRPMPAHQSFERRLIARIDKRLQELRIAGVGPLARENTKLVKDATRAVVRHETPREQTERFYLLFRGGAGFHTRIFWHFFLTASPAPETASAAAAPAASSPVRAARSRSPAQVAGRGRQSPRRAFARLRHRAARLRSRRGSRPWSKSQGWGR